MALEKAFRFEIYLNELKNGNNKTMKSFLKIASDNNIPAITARRDLKELVHHHYIKQEMGLLILVTSKNYEITRKEKLKWNKDLKEDVAQNAIKEIHSDKIFVGGGTTLELFVKLINKSIDFLYTNGLEIIHVAQGNELIDRVVSLGGRLRPQSSVFVGPITKDSIKDLEFDQCFLSVNEIDSEGNLYNSNIEESEIFNNLLLKSKEVYLLVDKDKFVKKHSDNLFLICHKSKITKIITNSTK